MTTADNWLAQLPENVSPERDKAILDAISNGIAVFDWVEITSIINDHQAIFQIFDDALHITLEDDSRFRPQVSASLSQKCADLLSASMITAKISDLAYQQSCVQFDYTALPASPQMSTTTYSKAYNKAVEKKRNGATGLIRDTGKHWILDNGLSMSAGAVNYGFYVKTGNMFKVIQTVGHMHNELHEDYSQTLTLMNTSCVVDGEKMLVTDVMSSPELSLLINYGGILKYTRQPL